MRGDNMVSLFLMESGYALDNHVVALCRARGEDNVLFLCSNKARYVLSSVVSALVIYSRNQVGGRCVWIERRQGPSQRI